MADYFKSDVPEYIIEDTLDYTPEQRAELARKLEQDLLDKLDTNFLFSRGESLKYNLIDINRVYNIM